MMQSGCVEAAYGAGANEQDVNRPNGGTGRLVSFSFFLSASYDLTMAYERGYRWRTLFGS